MMPFLLLLLVGVVYASSDLYQTLGVSRGANEGEIKKAFKEKSLQFHPDRNQDPSSSRKYQDIIQAYEVLKDNNKRHLYDQTGSTGMCLLTQMGLLNSHIATATNTSNTSLGSRRYLGSSRSKCIPRGASTNTNTNNRGSSRALTSRSTK